jgi:hypothetical protein
MSSSVKKVKSVSEFSDWYGPLPACTFLSDVKPASTYCSKSLPSNKTKKQWVLDLTTQGIEPNPGPQKSSKGQGKGKMHKKSRGKKGADGDIPRPVRCTVTTVSCTIPKVPRNYIFRFLDTTQSTWVGSNGGASAGGYFFTLTGNVSAASTLVSLFDQYRFLAARFRIIPRQNLIAPVTSTYPPLYVAIDYDNATAPSSRAAIQAYSNCSETQVYESVERVFCPHVALAAYNATFGGYANAAKMWIDSSTSNVQHYGVKYWIDTCPLPLPTWDVEVEYWVQFRNTI